MVSVSTASSKASRSVLISAAREHMLSPRLGIARGLWRFANAECIMLCARARGVSKAVPCGVGSDASVVRTALLFIAIYSTPLGIDYCSGNFSFHLAKSLESLYIGRYA